MKKKIYSLIIAFSTLFFYSQNTTDSLYVIVSAEYDKSTEIQNLEDLKSDFEFIMDKLLLSDNFKDPVKRKNILTPFNLVYPKNKINEDVASSSESIESYKKGWLLVFSHSLNHN